MFIVGLRSTQSPASYDGRFQTLLDGLKDIERLYQPKNWRIVVLQETTETHNFRLVAFLPSNFTAKEITGYVTDEYGEIFKLSVYQSI
jgi:hypothetical protein